MGTIVAGGVQYDFDGDGVVDQSADNLNPIQHTYTAGQYFPVVTIQTTTGKFSSAGGWNAPDGSRLRINVQSPPQQIGSAISVTDPIDLKATADGMLYIISRSAKKLFEYDTTQTPPQRIRMLSSIGTTPTGLDVDSAGNVYVALSGDNQVAKFNPTGNPPNGSFQLDTTFGNGTGKIGRSDKGTGAGNAEFNAPYDVAISPDGGGVSVSDSGNNRIQQFTTDGVFVGAFGQLGAGSGQFNSPKGLIYNTSSYLYIADSGNNRIVLAGSDGLIIGSSGTAGGDLGQFEAPANLNIGSRATYVADTGNNRVQSFSPPVSHAPLGTDPPTVRFVISSGLSQPAAVVAANNLTSEMLYVADTGNNRVLLYSLAGDEPTATWASMKARLAANDISGAASYFSVASADDYREALLIMPTAVSTISSIGTLTPVFIKDDAAEYYFTDTIDGQVITFPVQFTKENGVWKILEF